MSWTLDGIAEHAEAVLAWLERHEPVVACLRGTFVADAHFPLLPAWELGYYTKLFGHPQRPGVAILSVEPPRAVSRGLARDEARGAERRALSGRVAGVRLVNCAEPPEDRALRAHLDRDVAPHEQLLVAGASSSAGLVDLAASLGADHGVLANARLARKCVDARVAADVPTGRGAVVLTFEGLPPPQIPDLDIRR